MNKDKIVLELDRELVEVLINELGDSYSIACSCALCRVTGILQEALGEE